MINTIFSHLVAFVAGGVAMSKLLDLNRRPQHPRGPIGGDTDSVVQVMEHVRYHVAEARAWASSLPSSPGYVVDLGNLFAGAEAILQRRSNAQREARQPHVHPSTTPEERHGHD